MLIGFDYTPAHLQGGGIGRYVRELAHALSTVDNDNQYVLFVAGSDRMGLGSPLGSQFRWSTTMLTPEWLSRAWYRLHIPAPIELFVGRVDIFHATDFVLPPTLPRTRTILTVHDLSFERVPETASSSLRKYLQMVVPRSVKRADLVIADSEATRQDLVDLYDLALDRSVVILSGVNRRFFNELDRVAVMTTRNRLGIGPTPYILSVGTVQPRKNYVRLLHAVARLRQTEQDIQLVIAGGKGWLDSPIYQTIDSLNLGNVVKLLGFVDDSDLPALYGGAVCLAFPSLYEGFGLPVLEAMASGIPVLTSSVSSLPEAAGEAAILVNPYDLDEITDGLHRIIYSETLRDQLINRGRAHARQFTWERSARALLDAYRQLL